MSRTCSYRVIENCSDYFGRAEVSNSDLGWLDSQTNAKDEVGGDKTAAYAFGTLLDALITEPERINHINKTLDGNPIEPKDWDKAIKMRKSFLSDPFCVKLLEMSSFQTVMVRDVEFDFEGNKFTLPLRCKWDFFMNPMAYGGDLKSTTATTQEQFEAACHLFHYPRQRAFYMTVAECDFDVLIGISKVNYKVFKVFIRRDGNFFKTGYDELNRLAWKYYLMFG